ncbi:ribonuclease P protein component [Silvanigrella aquatica]|uniref:Uncharacterized protein n=1 Tax=Silvanigrella aquatica TaxID=1915309 RepID=A0A1L4D177_9BACT|nr:ribonuclease P protein component [Silvanigrella aquatica]APJ03962.1 hypothetical protein AXG55_08600 [Silvanigrella aquatica]
MINQPLQTLSKITNFSEFYSSATRFKTHHFLTYIVCKKNSGCESTLKFAVVTSKKGVHKRAVKRNRARRRLKNAFLNYLKTATFPPGVEIQVLFMANRSVLDAPWEKLLGTVHIAMQTVRAQCTTTLEVKL